jgi:hypothetical protein
MVLVDRPAQQVSHLVPGLNCALKEIPGGYPDALGVAEEFARGFFSVRPPGNRLTKLEKGDWRVAEVSPGRRRPVCLYCGHTFRPGEYVVICPCQAGGQEAACGAAIHDDPASGYTCWERWRPEDGKVQVCPVTYVRLDAKAHDA